MADKKISELTGISGANVNPVTDYFALVDTSGNFTGKITPHNVFYDNRTNFEDRGSLLTAIMTTGLSWKDGTLLFDGTCFYKYVDSATAISDIDNVIPFDPTGWCACLPDHFGENTTPGTTDMTAEIQAAIDYTLTLQESGVVGLLAAEYLVSDGDADGHCIKIGNKDSVDSQGVSLKGQGMNATRISVSTTTANTIYVGGDDPFNGDTVRDIYFEDILFLNEATDPESGSHIHADRSVVYINRCHLKNHYRAIELLGCPETCTITNNQITQTGSNITSTTDAQAESAAIFVGRRLLDSGVASPYSDTTELNFDALTGAFTLGLTVTGGTSGATGVIERITVSGTTGTLKLSSISGTFQDNEALTDTSTGAATANGVVGDNYYRETNSVYITNNNIRLGPGTTVHGADYGIMISCVDGLYCINNHIAWASKACIHVAQQQPIIGFTGLHIANNLLDPFPAKTDYGLHVEDFYGVDSNTTGSMTFTGNQVAGADLDSVRIEWAIDRVTLTGNELKGSGRYHLYVATSGVNNLLVNGNQFYNCNGDSGNSPAVYIANVNEFTFTSNQIDVAYHGIRIASANPDKVIIKDNIMTGLNASGVGIFLPTGIEAKEWVIKDNIIPDSNSVTNDGSSAFDNSDTTDDLVLPVGQDTFYVTFDAGDTTIDTIWNGNNSSTWKGREVTLNFSNAGTLVSTGGNLTGLPADLPIVAGLVLKLIFDGSEWYISGFNMPISGSNANGEYTLFPDGTLWCWDDKDLAYVGLSNMQRSWTFPVAFSAIPVLSASIDMNDLATSATPSADEVGSIGYFNESTTACTFILYRINGTTNFGASDTCEMKALAIGRWY